MKGIFGLLGLLLSLVIVGVLVKKQLTSTQQMLPALEAPMATDPQSSAVAQRRRYASSPSHFSSSTSRRWRVRYSSPAPSPTKSRCRLLII